MKNATTYKFSLPDGQTYGGRSPERIFAQYPAAVITHRLEWDGDGRSTEHRLAPPIQASSIPVDAPDALVVITDEPLAVEPLVADDDWVLDADDRESGAGRPLGIDADEGSDGGEWD